MSITTVIVVIKLSFIVIRILASCVLTLLVRSTKTVMAHGYWVMFIIIIF